MSLNGGVFLPNALYAPFFTLSGLMRKAQEKKTVFSRKQSRSLPHIDHRIELNRELVLHYCMVEWFTNPS